MSILIFAVILFFLILIHEFGHFIVAKWAGIRVDEFGIGFPPRLGGIKRGETLFSINALPVGGFVKIFGENPDDTSINGPDRERSFVHKPKWIQALVLLAGIISHILLAWIIFIITLASGMTLPVIDEYRPYMTSPEEVTVSQVIANSPAQEAGITPSDRVVALKAQGEALNAPTPDTVPQFVEKHKDESISLTYRRGQEEKTVQVHPQEILVGTERHSAIGVVLVGTATIKLPFGKAIVEAAKLTTNLFYATFTAIISLIVGAVSFTADLSQVAGPVGIVGYVGNAAAEGTASLLTFVALLAINLAIINLVPFPSLDGGRLLFIIIEAIKGSPIRPSIANALNAIGLGLIILLIIAVTWNDISKLISG